MARWRRNKQQIQEDIDSQTKVCCVCETRKSFNEFYNYQNKSDGKSYRCKECDEAASSSYRSRNSDRCITLQRVRTLKSKYNLEENSFSEMMNYQRGCCKICGESLYDPLKDVQLSVDHNHETGEVRGLLCFNCNILLGAARDNITILEEAIKYLTDTH